jgi:hypothetical protein
MYHLKIESKVFSKKQKRNWPQTWETLLETREDVRTYVEGLIAAEQVLYTDNRIEELIVKELNTGKRWRGTNWPSIKHSKFVRWTEIVEEKERESF